MQQTRVLAGVAVAFLVLLAALVAASGPRVSDTLGRVTGLGPECTVQDGDRSVDLSRDEAEAASSGAATAVRRGWGPGRATRSVTAAVEKAGSSLDAADATEVTAALTGRARAELTCTAPPSPDPEADTLDRRGLTARAERVRTDLLDAFGPQQLGGYAPGGVHGGHMPGSAHYAGRAIDVFFRPATTGNRTRGWAVAQYLVANAERLDVRTVIYDAHIWSTWRAEEGWRDYDPPTGGRSRAVARVLLHRDHVHVDVAD